MNKLFSRVSITIFLSLFLVMGMMSIQPLKPVQAASAPECWGVFVGIEDYQNLTDNNYGINDAQEFRDKLSPTWGSNNMMLLTNSQATKAGILNSIDWLASRAGASDTVLFYCSVHTRTDGSFCPYDALSMSGSNDISPEEFANAFDAIVTNNIIVIFECPGAVAIQNSISGYGRVIIMSSRTSGASYYSNTYQHGLFTHFLLQSFDQFDAVDTNNDFDISTEEIFEYTESAFAQYQTENSYSPRQYPQMNDGSSDELPMLSRFVFNINTTLPSGTTLLTLDGQSHTTIPEPMIWVPGGSHTISVHETVNQGSDIRYVFKSWSDGNKSTTRVVSKGSYTPIYDKEYLLSITSPYGEVQGSGWYKEGDVAGFSVTDYIESADTRHYFNNWSGDYSGSSPSASLSMNGPKTVTAQWRHEYLLTLSSAYGTLTGAGWYAEETSVSFSVTDYIESTDTKHYFTNWSGDYTGTLPTASLEMNEPKTLMANWRHEYLLTISSEYSEPTGADWYREGETASLSVEPVQGALIRQVFDGWSGDLTDDDADSSIVMNSPKDVTANWRTDSMYLYLLIGGIVVLAGAVITTIYLLRRRAYATRGVPISPNVQSAVVPTPPPVQPEPAPPAAEAPPQPPEVEAPPQPQAEVTPPEAAVPTPPPVQPEPAPPAAETPPQPPEVEAPPQPQAEVPLPEEAKTMPSAPVIEPAEAAESTPPEAEPHLAETPAELPEEPTTPTVRASYGKLALADNTEIQLTGPTTDIGRDNFGKLASDDTLNYVSRQHCRITTEEGKYFIEDLQSANGTKVNGVDIVGKGKQELKDGDRIDLADVVSLTFRVSGTS